MKTIVAGLCILVAVAYAARVLEEEECREYRELRKLPPRDKNATSLRLMYFFSNVTNRCEKVYTRAKAVGNTFANKKDCKNGCPYGKHKKRKDHKKAQEA